MTFALGLIWFSELARSFESNDFRWKADRLQYLTIGLPVSPAQIAVPSTVGILVFKRAEQMGILGTVQGDATMPQHLQMQSQLAKAERLHYSVTRAYSCHTKRKQRFQTWLSTVGGCAQYCSDSWWLSADTLRTIRAWENGLMRRVFKVSPNWHVLLGATAYRVHFARKV